MCVGVCAGAGGTLCAGRPGELEHLLDRQSGRPGSESLTLAAVGHDLRGTQQSESEHS